MRITVLVLAIAGCTTAPLEQPILPNTVDSPPAAAVDAAPRAQDLAELEQLDMAKSAIAAGDMLTSPPAADLARAEDLAPACGGAGEPCCSGSCSSGLSCMTSIVACGAAPVSTCLAPQNCGYYPLPCCGADGAPDRGAGGSCELAGAGGAPEACYNGTCHTCN